METSRTGFSVGCSEAWSTNINHVSIHCGHQRWKNQNRVFRVENIREENITWRAIVCWADKQVLPHHGASWLWLSKRYLFLSFSFLFSKVHSKRSWRNISFLSEHILQLFKNSLRGTIKRRRRTSIEGRSSEIANTCYLETINKLITARKIIKDRMFTYKTWQSRRVLTLWRYF